MPKSVRNCQKKLTIFPKIVKICDKKFTNSSNLETARTRNGRFVRLVREGVFKSAQDTEKEEMGAIVEWQFN